MKKSLLLIAPMFLNFLSMAQEKQKPNIMFIFADDLSINALGSTSNGEVKTPNLDRLRRDGAFFSHAFNQGGFSAAISEASRAMLMTGKYLWDACDEVQGYIYVAEDVKEWPDGITPYTPKKLEHPSPLCCEYIRNAGYETYMSGKWHVRRPVEKVFDHVSHVRPGMPTPTNACYERKLIEGQLDEWTPTDPKFGGYWEGGKHWSEVLCDDALKYVDEVTHKDNPFFMYLAFNAPHDPRQAP